VLAPTVVVGATLLLAGCGGVLGGKGLDDEAAGKLASVACAITNASGDDTNYAAAITNAQLDITFEGLPEDDLTKNPRRIAIFKERRAELAQANVDLAAIKPTTTLETTFVDAAKADLSEAIQLVEFDLKWAPGDPKAPDPPQVIPTRFSTLVEEQTADGQKLLRVCTVPADLARRSKAYGG
jgi:hypothetical protein